MTHLINRAADTMVALALREANGIDVSDDLALLSSAIDTVNAQWNRYYTVVSLHSYKSTGLCETVFDGKLYTL